MWLGDKGECQLPLWQLKLLSVGLASPLTKKHQSAGDMLTILLTLCRHHDKPKAVLAWFRVPGAQKRSPGL